MYAVKSSAGRWVTRPERPACLLQGNPFKAFWETFDIAFVEEKGVRYGMSPEQWRDELPASVHPVIAMPGAPASFPTQLVRARLRGRWVLT
jgi:peptide-O-fucosyltransferase